MTYLEELNGKIKVAMKAKSSKLKPYRYFKSLLIENEKAKKPIEEEQVLRNYKKSLEKAVNSLIGLSPNGNCQDTMREIALLDKLLPKLMTREEISQFIVAKGLPDGMSKGQTMGHFNKLLKGKAESRIVADIIKGMFP